MKSAALPFPHALTHLAADRQEKLAELLDQCLERLEGGQAVELESLAQQHPDLADSLRAYLKSLSFLHLAMRESSGKPTPPLAVTALDEQRLGDYKLVRELGRGGMGVVYEALQISLGRRVALKVLPFAAVLDERQVARFNNEAQAAAQLHHNHIVPVYAVGCERGVHYYSMQYIDGQSLDQALREVRGAVGTEILAQAANSRSSRDRLSGDNGVSSPAADAAQAVTESFCHPTTVRSIRSRHYVRSIVELGVQAAEALHYAHTCGVVHRDVKPSNLLLDRHGKLWVADFGLARIKDRRELTQAGELLGTVRYMSPEQAAGRAELVDHRTDVYSLGITLYELLTLRPAFDGSDRPQLLRQIEAHEPVAPRKWNASVTHDLETILLKSIAKGRDDRYATAAELAEDLQRHLDGRPALARRLTRIDRAGRYVARHARVMATLAGIFILALLGVSACALLLARKNDQISASQQRAELHLQTAQRVVNRFQSEVAQQLERVSGAEPIRAELLREALAYYESFLAYAANDRSLATEIAQTELQMARLHERLGNLTAALDGYRAARATFLDVPHDATPNSEVCRAAAAVCENNRGVVLVQLGRYAAADQAYSQAILEQSRAAATADSRVQRRTELAVTHLNRGRLQTQIGEYQRAQTSLQTAEALLHQALRQPTHPDQPVDRAIATELAATYNALADLPVAPLSAQARSLQAAIAIYSDLLRSAPGDRETTRLLALTHNNLGGVYRSLHPAAAAETDVESGRDELGGDSDSQHDATAEFRVAIELQTALMRQAPAVVAYRAELATSWNNLGQEQLESGELSAAAADFGEARQLLETLCREHPQQLMLRSSLGGVLNNLALVYEQQHNAVAAIEVLRIAIDHQRFAHRHAPESQRYRSFLEEHEQNLARVLQQLEQRGAAASTQAAAGTHESPHHVAQDSAR